MEKLNNLFFELEKHRFHCSSCGSRMFVKICKPFGSLHFYEGSFMCASCGTSVNHGKILNYYNDSFYCVPDVIQLDLFL